MSVRIKRTAKIREMPRSIKQIHIFALNSFVMKNILLSFFLLVFLTLSAGAQDYRQIIRENPAWAAANLYYYDYEETDMTQAPKGYKPFYINYYGRHGSRYMSSSVETDAVRPVFEAADSCGLLTDQGKLFWNDLKAILKEQDGMVGMLTTRGALEHRGMGERMARRFPEIFGKRSDRKEVRCISSTSPRCLVSMTNFTDGLSGISPDMEVSYITGNRYYAYIAYHPEVEEGVALSGRQEMDFRREESDPEALLRHLFTDSGKVLGWIGDPYIFERRLYMLSCMGHLTDYGRCLLEYFPEDALVKNWEARNARFYVAYSNSKELPHYASDVAAPLLREMLSQMDAALEEGSGVAADLCFGHDVTLMPLISHIGVKGMEELLSFEEVNGRWNSSDFICMGSNIQFVFYHNRKGEVLVKILYNEKETSLPALKAFDGPYYRWEDLREYLVSSLI